jgi:hypothetical protein
MNAIGTVVSTATAVSGTEKLFILKSVAPAASRAAATSLSGAWVAPHW